MEKLGSINSKLAHKLVALSLLLGGTGLALKNYEPTTLAGMKFKKYIVSPIQGISGKIWDMIKADAPERTRKPKDIFSGKLL